MTITEENLKKLNGTSTPAERFATYIPSRSPALKIYVQRGHAFASLTNRNSSWMGNWHEQGCELYREINGTWEDVTEEFKP